MPPIPGLLARRLGLLLALLGVVVVGGVGLAIYVAHNAHSTIARMADVELEAANLARQFRTAVDDLHGALLRVDTDQAEDSLIVIRDRRQVLSLWVSARLATVRTDSERRVLSALSTELHNYFRKLDQIETAPPGGIHRLDRETLADFDDAAIRLQGLADEFGSVHDTGERELLRAALRSVHRLRNLLFLCITLVLVATGVLVGLLYRDVVRPLRRKLVEHELLLAQREKLAALGTLAAGVAHEIRNPLTAIKARLYTLRRAAPAPEAAEDVKAIAGEIDRLDGIVRDMLGYARPAEPRLAEVDLSAWVREFGAFVEPELSAHGISLHLDAAVSVVVAVDPGQLRQVALNLVRNAREAFAGQPGKIVVGARREHGTLRGQRGIEVAVLCISDDGPGIPNEVQARLFDPFFTTKASGTGLGLPIVARLIEAHGGEIAFQTAPGKGTRFDVRLPVRKTTP